MNNQYLIPTLIIAFAVPTTASAQFSDSFNFLKAVRERDGAKVTELLNKPGSVIVNTRDGASGETGLHIVTARRDALWMGFLLQRGANPDTRDARGNTALMIATDLRWAEGVQTLLSRRTSVDLANSTGETPLSRAVQIMILLLSVYWLQPVPIPIVLTTPDLPRKPLLNATLVLVQS